MTEQVTAAPALFHIKHPTLEAHYMKLLVYGEYGAGKTVLAATSDDVPEMRNVLYIDAEAGDLALSDRPHLDVVKINKYSQIAKIYEYLRWHCRFRDIDTPEARAKLAQLETQLKGTPVPNDRPTLYHTVVIDSLTEVQTYLMYQLLGMDPDAWALDAVPQTAEWGDWRASSDMIQLLARQFRDLPMHVIVVLSEQEVEDRRQILRRINLPGKLSSRIQAFWDMVGYLATAKDVDGNTQRRLYLRKSDTFQAKHRFRRINVDYVDAPTIPKLLDLAKQEWAATPQETTDAHTPAAASPQPRSAPAGSGSNGSQAVRRAPAGGSDGRGSVRVASVRQ
jgi:hypothetical protein